MTKQTNTKKLIFSALMIAIAAVLSCIKVIQMPLGGSVTLLSMLPIVLIPFCYGTRHGLLCALLYGVIQLFLSLGALLGYALSPAVLIASFFLDYLLAYAVLGLAGVFRSSGTFGMIVGVAGSVLLRFFCHVLSGAVLFDIWCPEGWNSLWYSICYNGAFMLPELAFTVIGSVILIRLPFLQTILPKR